jgi:hypothetical protein
MVDFFDLATSSRWMIQRALREQDDDFTLLDVSSSATPPDNDSILSLLQEQEDSAYQSGAEARPFLSKSAEAELYLLAANFLLCKKHQEEEASSNNCEAITKGRH